MQGKYEYKAVTIKKSSSTPSPAHCTAARMGSCLKRDINYYQLHREMQLNGFTEQSWITIKVLINECVFTLQLYLGMWVGSSNSHGLKSTYKGPSTLCSLETPALWIGAKHCVRPQFPKLLMIPWKLRSAPKPLERWPRYCARCKDTPKALQGAPKTMHLVPKILATCCWPRWPPWLTTAPQVLIQESTPWQR